MRYLGRIAGDGVLLRDGQAIARASYDFEGFAGPRGDNLCSGEIILTRTALESVFGAAGVQLRTDNGRLLDLRFSEKALGRTAVMAQVEVTGQLPGSQAEWRSGTMAEPDSATSAA
jgi:hypothetical protein